MSQFHCESCNSDFEEKFVLKCPVNGYMCPNCGPGEIKEIKDVNDM
jgi:hypothetical protein